MNEVKIKKIRKMDPSEYEGKFRYSINVDDNHNYFINNGILSENCIVICDETQNINMHTFRTIITRMGKNSKMIFLGDIDQCDLPDREKSESCLGRVFDLFKNEEFAGTIQFEDSECVRNPLIEKILKILK